MEAHEKNKSKKMKSTACRNLLQSKVRPLHGASMEIIVGMRLENNLLKMNIQNGCSISHGQLDTYIVCELSL